MNKKLKLSILTSLFALAGYAEVKLDGVFSSNMMLQQEAPIAFFGMATPGSKIKTSFAGKDVEVTAGENGAWRAEFPPMKAGKKTYDFSANEKENKVALSNIIIGDVWVCAGQSNMEMPIGAKFRRGWSAQNCEKEVAAANYPDIRYADQTNRISLNKPLTDATYAFGNGWVSCSPTVAEKFSATAYFFARKLHQDMKIPIGLINLTWSGTRIEPWISLEGYKAANLEADLANIAKLSFTSEQMKTMQAEVDAEFAKNLDEWQKKVDAAADPKEKANLQKAKPRKRQLPWQNPQTYSNLYNGMVNPWITLPIKGVIWYQGCSNNGQLHYYPLHKALIADWRAKWNNPNMPFLVVQLASFSGPNDWKNAPCEDARYALTRDIQAKLTEDKNVGLACTIDIGEQKNIHPANKQDVGLRLALEAERIAYGKKIVSRGPMLDKTNIEGNAIRVSFKYAEKGLKTKDGLAPNAFAIAGEDKKFVWADAKIDGNTVLVSSPSVPLPKYVRYAYAAFRDDCNLQNAEGLPAYPFRSDAVEYSSIK